MKRVAIIGGGFAGLAAGVELAARGFSVDVLEARPRLGGRAYSFTDDASGEVVDNGQHAMMGCYTHTLAFLEQIGATRKLMRQPNLHVELIHPQRGTGTITGSSLPSPLHLLTGILGYRLLSRSERVCALLGGMRLMALRRRRDPQLAQWTVQQALIAVGQSANARSSFWNPVAIATLNESPLRAASALRRLEQFEASPIVSTHLWFDRPVLSGEFVGLLGTTTQWIFNRSKLTANGNGHGPQCLSAVISAGRDAVEWDTRQVVDTVVNDLRSLVPAARQAQLLRSVVVKEKYATISPTPAAERLRPPPQTSVDNFFLAGDWVQTGLPPTIESAVVSGQRAAQLVADRLAGH